MTTRKPQPVSLGKIACEKRYPRSAEAVKERRQSPFESAK